MASSAIRGRIDTQRRSDARREGARLLGSGGVLAVAFVLVATFGLSSARGADLALTIALLVLLAATSLWTLRAGTRRRRGLPRSPPSRGTGEAETWLGAMLRVLESFFWW